MNPQNVYAWTDVARPVMTGWALAALIAVAAAVSSLLDFAQSGAATQIVLSILGVALAGGILLGRIRCEVSIRDGQLVFRSRPIFGSVLNWPWSERRIARQSIDGSRLDRSPWADPKLTIWLDDGSSLRIAGSQARRDSFDSFAAAFRSFAGADPGRIVQEERKSVWSSFPIPHAIAGAVVVGCGVFMILTVRGMLDQKITYIFVIGGAWFAVAGVRMFIERWQG